MKKKTQQLTDPEREVLKILMKRTDKDLTTKNGDIVSEWGRNRIRVYRILKSLCDKKLIKRYARNYYTLA